jgi:hypothetical protein
MREVEPMTSIFHSVLVLGTTVLSLTILILGGHVINLLSQKTDAVDVRKVLNYRVNRTSLFERATIAGTITALYVVLMISSFVIMSWGSLR